jgi:hypothetical protein
MDIRSIWRKQRLNDLIRKEEREKNSGKSLLIGTISVALIVGTIFGSMCHNNYKAGNAYNPVQDCIKRHYKALDNKPTLEQQRYIREACRQYK